MTYTYCVRKNTVRDEERRKHTVYGIEAIGLGGKIISSFSDVFFDRQKAEHFAGLCNKCGFSLSHFRDAVGDALEE